MLAETKQLMKDTECMEKTSKFFLTEKDYPIENIDFVKQQKPNKSNSLLMFQKFFKLMIFCYSIFECSKKKSKSR